MRYIAKAGALAVVLTLFVSTMVLAGDYVDDATQALQHASIYVAPGTEGTDRDTSAKLQGRLKDNDNIVLVMLPSAAEKELGADISTIASRLSEKLGDRRIIGLAMGRKVVGYAPTTPTMPAGIASDLMGRAESVSNDPVTALVTFVQNMHRWQAEHPQPKPLPIELPKLEKEGSPWSFWPWVVGVAMTVFAVGRYLFFRGDSSKQSEADRTKFDAPHRVGELLTRIANMRSQVLDVQLQQTITQMCRDTEVYFSRYTSDKGHDALQFENYLRSIVDVITKYVEVQNFRRYYDNPTGLMQQGKKAVEDFAEYVLKSCRRGSAARLIEYSVDTNILSAQRYR